MIVPGRQPSRIPDSPRQHLADVVVAPHADSDQVDSVGESARVTAQLVTFLRPKGLSASWRHAQSTVGQLASMIRVAMAPPMAPSPMNPTVLTLVMSGHNYREGGAAAKQMGGEGCVPREARTRSGPFYALLDEIGMANGVLLNSPVHHPRPWPSCRRQGPARVAKDALLRLLVHLGSVPEPSCSPPSSQGPKCQSTKVPKCPSAEGQERSGPLDSPCPGRKRRMHIAFARGSLMLDPVDAWLTSGI